MTGEGLPRLMRGASRAAHAGFPWASPRGQGHSAALRVALRKSVIGQWPPAARPAARLLMLLLWPFESLRDAIATVFGARPEALAGHRRAAIALGAWRAALRHNLPPVDFVAYRLFERDRPPAPRWLHSADAHCHFSALAAPKVRGLARDKLAFSDLAAGLDMPIMPVLAAWGPDGATREFTEGGPPPEPLVVKPRFGHAGDGLDFWNWDGTAHAPEARDERIDLGETFVDWLSRASAERDLIVQTWATAPDHVGGLHPTEAPVISLLSAEWPDGRRALVYAQMLLVAEQGSAERALHLEIDVASGQVAGLPPGTAAPIWKAARRPPVPVPFAIPAWGEMLRSIDRVHDALPGAAPVLKWDLLWTRDGIRLLEVNTGPGVFQFQATSLRPLTETPLGDALEAWAA